MSDKQVYADDEIYGDAFAAMSDEVPEHAAVSAFAEVEDEDMQDGQLWPGDKGSFDLAARKALLKLIRGPMLTADEDAELWAALLNNRRAIESYLAELFLCLVLDDVNGIAFVRNAQAEGTQLPKTVRNQPLNLLDTVLILTLRKLLLIEQGSRLIVGKAEILPQIVQFKPVVGCDDAAFQRAFDSSWSRMVGMRILQASEGDGRFEVSPVLRLIFGAEEVAAVSAEFDRLIAKSGATEGTLFNMAAGEPTAEEEIHSRGKAEGSAVDVDDDGDTAGGGEQTLFTFDDWE